MGKFLLISQFVFLIPILVQCNQCPLDHRHHSAYGQWANRVNQTHRLSLLIPSLNHHAFRTIDADDLLSTEPVLLAGSTECPDAASSQMGDHLMARSLCPWYWKMNYNKNRIPAVLPEAVCACRKAVVTRGMVGVQCQPMTMHVRVLELDESCTRYEERTVEIAVACVSAFQTSVRLNKVPGVERVHQEVDLMPEIK